MLQKVEKTFVQFPFFPIRPVSVCRRIQDYALIDIASAGFSPRDWEDELAEYLRTLCGRI